MSAFFKPGARFRRMNLSKASWAGAGLPSGETLARHLSVEPLSPEEV